MPLAQMFSDIQQAVLVDRVWVLLLAAYIFGSIPFGLVLARRFAGEDVRTKGSGNIGATNVARVVGPRLGIVTLVLDGLKGAVFVMLARYFFADEALLTVIELCAGTCAFLGHCFSIFLKFRGGKGVATAAAVFVAHRPVFGLVGIFAFALIFASFRKVSLGAIIGAFIMVPTYFILGPVDGTMPLFLFMLGVMIARHHENIRRLIRREELAATTDE